MPSSFTRQQAVLFAILVAATIPYFVGLGDSSLWDANESFYAQTPREMLASGDYINPTFNFQPRFNKPVLPYWIVAAFYHLFGVSERAERIPIALGAVVLLATAFRLGCLVKSREAGLLAALVLATSPRFLLFARRIIIDVHVSMFAGLTLLFFALAEACPPRKRRYLLLMYLSAGLGMLTKGPVAFVLPGLVFFIYLVIERRLADIRHMMLPTGALIGAAIVLPWYVLVYLQHGWGYIQSFLVGENLLRYTQTVGIQSRGPLFYPPVMLGDLFPWSLFLPLALLAGLRRWSFAPPIADDPLPGGNDAQTGAPHRMSRLLTLWVVVIVVFFSLSQTKQDLYIFPIVSAEAALIGGLLASGLDAAASLASIRRLRRTMLASGLMLLLVGAVLLVVVVMPGTFSLRGAAAISIFVVLGGLFATAFGAKGKLFAAVSTLGVSFAAVSWCLVLATLPDVERYKPVRPMVDLIRSLAGENAVIGYYKAGLPSMVYYLNRPVQELYDPEQLKRAFASDEDVYFLMTESDYQAIREALPVRTYILDKRPLLDVKPRNFLEGTALPQILLVSNRLGPPSFAMSIGVTEPNE